MDLSYGIGHNAAPLAEVLAEESRALAIRADELVSAAQRARADSDDTAGRCVTLAKMLKAHMQDVDKQREATKKPFLEGGRTVDAHYSKLLLPLSKAATDVVALLDTYRRKKEAEAAAERKKLEEEAAAQRKAAEEAEQARQAAEAKALASDSARASEKARREALEAETEAQRLAAAAAAKAAQAAATVAAPVASDFGKAHRRTFWKVEITDLTVALRHARKVNEAALRDCVLDIYQRQVKAGARELPGASVVEDSLTVVR